MIVARKFIILLLLLYSFTYKTFGQGIQDHNINNWLMYFGDHPVSQNWGIHLEAQIRRSDVGLTWQQLLLRPGVNYQINKYLLLTGGYAYARSWPYGDHPSGNVVVPEHRFFEQLIVKHKVGAVTIQHRLREEQRLIGQVPIRDADVAGWETRNRFRYMLRGDIPLPIGSKKRFGLALYDEFFVQFGANRGPRYLDQNRAYAALTWKATDNNRFEFGYLHQYVPQRNGIVTEQNHTLQFALYSTTPFRRSRKSP